MSLLMLFSTFTGSRPATMLADDFESEPLSDNIRSRQMLELGESVRNNSQEIQADDLSSSILIQDSDEDIFVGDSSS
jgi:hypothetical protein